MKKDRHIYIDILKIIACILVINNHSGGYLLNYVDKTNIDVLFYIIMFHISKIAVPIFLLCTGALEINKEWDYKTSLKKISRIFIPLLTITIILYFKDRGLGGFNPIEFIKSFVSSPISTHLWYLYMLIIIYIFMPILQKINKSLTNIDYKVLLVLTIIYGTVQLDFFNFSSYFLIAFFPIPIMYILIGGYLNKMNISKKIFIISIIVFILSIFISSYDVYSNYLETSAISYKYDNIFLITTILPAISVFIIVKYLFEKHKIKNQKTNNLISNISINTFGVYLIHFYLINYIYESLITKIYKINLIIGNISLFVISFIVCEIIIYLLRFIKPLRRFI